MAQQAKKKAARQPRRSDKATAGTSRVRTAGSEASARLDELERERNDALRQLAEAQQRIKELEDTQEQVVNRIDWVIDSLHNMKQDAT